MSRAPATRYNPFCYVYTSSFLSFFAFVLSPPPPPHPPLCFLTKLRPSLIIRTAYRYIIFETEESCCCCSLDYYTPVKVHSFIECNEPGLLIAASRLALRKNSLTVGTLSFFSSSDIGCEFYIFWLFCGPRFPNATGNNASLKGFSFILRLLFDKKIDQW